MTKLEEKQIKPYKYNNPSKNDLDELAKRWVEMLVERLQKSSFSELDKKKKLA